MRFIVICLFVCSTIIVTAQVTDTSGVREKDKSKKIKKEKIKGEGHSVKAATLFSLIPGGGQVYNKKYWKVPIIYLGFGAIAYFLDLNKTKFDIFQTEFAARLDPNLPVDPLLDIFSDADIKELRDYYRGFYEVTIIFGVGLYVLQIIDANVDAHLFYFDVSDDLSLKISPAPVYAGNASYPGISLALNFK